MIRKILLIAALGYVSSGAWAQTKIDFDYKLKEIVLPALKKELTSKDNYSITYPSKLAYFSYSPEIEREIGYPFINLNAQQNSLKANYRFEVKTPGIQGITLREIKCLNALDQTPCTGYVREYASTFPCTLIVKNADGIVIDSVIISGNTDTLVTTLHRDFLSTDNRGASPKPIVPVSTAAQINMLESTYGTAIHKKIEQIVSYQMFQKVAATITFLYKNYHNYRELFGFGFIKTKRGATSPFPEIDYVVSNFKVALDSLGKGNWQSCRSMCEANKKVLEELLARNSEVMDKNVKEIIYYNLSHAYMLTNNFEAAWKYYDLFLQFGAHPDSGTASHLRNRITTLQTYYNLKIKVS